MKILAPWSAEFVVQLNENQQDTMRHPYTCGNRHVEGHQAYAKAHRQHDHGILVATRHGWQCPVCDYKQDWAHS